MVYVQNAAGNPFVLLQNYCKRVKVTQLPVTSYQVPGAWFNVQGS